MENKYCPLCGAETLRFIEVCDEDDFVKKTLWVCDNEFEPDCADLNVYLYQHFGQDR